jgi:5-methylcytosine-specific restriction enzyme A
LLISLATGSSDIDCRAPAFTVSRRPDYRSPEAAEYRKLYKQARWLKLRTLQLQRKPLCEWCEAKGLIVIATVAHHSEPHRGDMAKFYGVPLTSLCAPCHDNTAAHIERKGYSNDIGLDGWPTDNRHPANAKQ